MADAPCVYYLEWAQHVQVECVVPVAEGTVPAAGATIKEFPGTEAFMGTHTGPHAGLQETWAALWAEVARLGLQPDGPPWERYVTDPEDEPDTSRWVTEVYVPVKIMKV